MTSISRRLILLDSLYQRGWNKGGM